MAVIRFLPEARLGAWEKSLGARGALRRLAAATGPSVAVGGLSGLSEEAACLAAEAFWSPGDETRASTLVRLVELADIASNGGDDERILALDAELRDALGPGATSVVLAAGRGRLVLPADPLVGSSGPGGTANPAVVTPPVSAAITRRARARTTSTPPAATIVPSTARK